MSIRSTSLALSILSLFPVGLVGCGGDETSRIRLVPVNGTVTLNGKPLEGAEVSFAPDTSNEASTPGSDITGPEGNYKAMFRGRSGLAPGKYAVVITKTLLPPGASKGDMENDPGMYAEAFRNPRSNTKGQGPAATEIRGDFGGEVPPGGAKLDFDVMFKETPPAGSKK